MSITRYDYPDGSGEATAVSVRRSKRKRKASKLGGKRGPSGNLALSQKAARVRARRNVRRFVLWNGLLVMVTLTFPGKGVHEYCEAYRLAASFMKVSFLSDLGPYLCVPELHPKGHGWHWHILVRRRLTKIELEELREGWTEYLAQRGMKPTGGARYVRVNVTEWPGAEHAARYASKYVSKTFSDGVVAPGRHRYLRSRAGTPRRKVWGACSLDLLEAVVPDFAEIRQYAADEEDGTPAVRHARWGPEGSTSA